MHRKLALMAAVLVTLASLLSGGVSAEAAAPKLIVKGAVRTGTLSKLIPATQPTVHDRVRAATWYKNAQGKKVVRWTRPVSPTKIPKTGYSWAGYQVKLGTKRVNYLNTSYTSSSPQTFNSTSSPRVSLLYQKKGRPLLIGPEVTAREIDGPIVWAWLGDSYAAGDGAVGAYQGPARGTLKYVGPSACWRSHGAWSPQVVDLIGGSAYIDLKSQACNGATTKEVEQQLRAVGQDVDIVTLSAGGNNIGFRDIASTCVLKTGCDPLSAPPGADTISVMQTKLTSLITQAVTLKSRPKVFVATYPALLPPPRLITGDVKVGDCTGLARLKFSRDEATTLSGVLQPRLNEAVTVSARRAGALVLDMASVTNNRWVNSADPWIHRIRCAVGQVPHPESFHPTLQGQNKMTSVLRGNLDKPIPAPQPSYGSVPGFPIGGKAPVDFLGVSTESTFIYPSRPQLTPAGGLGICTNKTGNDYTQVIERDGTRSGADACVIAAGGRAFYDRLGNYFLLNPNRVGLIKYKLTTGERWDLPNIVGIIPAHDGGPMLVQEKTDDGKVRLAILDPLLMRTVVPTTPISFAPDKIWRTSIYANSKSVTSYLGDSGFIWRDRLTGKLLRELPLNETTSAPPIYSTNTELFVARPPSSDDEPCTVPIEKHSHVRLMWSTSLPLCGDAEQDVIGALQVFAVGDGGALVTWHATPPNEPYYSLRVVRLSQTGEVVDSYSIDEPATPLGVDVQGGMLYTTDDFEGEYRYLDAEKRTRVIAPAATGAFLGVGQVWVQDWNTTIGSYRLDTPGDFELTRHHRE